MFQGSSSIAPMTPPPFSRGGNPRRFSRNVTRPALFQFPAMPPPPPTTTPERDFAQLLTSNLGSPFLTISDLPEALDMELDMVDGALSAVPRSFTVTRPPSPVPTMDFSMISRPTSQIIDEYQSAAVPHSLFFVSPSKKSLYSGASYSPGSSASGSPQNNIKNILPRLWDALSSPGKKSRSKASRSDSGFDFEGYSYEDLPPLDGEEGELIDDEACLIEVIDVRAVTGIGKSPNRQHYYVLTE